MRAAPRVPAKIILLLLAIPVAVAILGVFVVPRMLMTPAERVIDDRLYNFDGSMNHVADLQARPAVADALQRLRAAGVCDLYFSVKTSRRTSSTKLRLCDAAAEFRLDADALKRDLPQWSGFAVLTDDDATQYLVALGKHGHVEADAMETVVTTVVDRTIAALPALQAKAQADAADAQRRQADDAAARRRAQESFK